MMRQPLSPLPSPSGTHRSGRGLALLLAAGVILIFGLGVAWNITLPGLYMDAVNPDYLVVRALGHEAYRLPIWVLPGNLVFDRFPIITSLYHGTGHVWFALPFFAVFGVGLVSLRIAQALFGVAILLGVFAILRRAQAGRTAALLAALTALALALDPVFVFAFRTQFYITLAATAWLLAALLAGHAALQPRGDQHARWLILLAGLCYGLSIFGYFIYGFFAPALLLALILRSRRVGLVRCGLTFWTLVRWLLAGLFIGCLGYIAGYAGIAVGRGGLGGFLDYVRNMQSSLGAFNSSFTPAQTFEYFQVLVSNVFSNAWQHSLMFGDGWPQPASSAKFVILLILPWLMWLVTEISGKPSRWLRLSLALMLSWTAVAFAFGSRVSGHHFAVLLPLSYLALGLGLIALAAHVRSRVPALIAACVLVGLGSINAVGQWTTQQQLVATGGRKLFSDAINRFAADALIERRAQFVVLPDWGLFMPFQFLTDGQIEHMTDIDVPRLRGELCKGRSVAVALINDDQRARLATLAEQLQWTAPTLQDYADREGKTVFVVGTYASDATIATAQGCAAPAAN